MKSGVNLSLTLFTMSLTGYPFESLYVCCRGTKKNKTMKLKTFLIGAGLLLGMITETIAQAPAHDSIRVRIVKEENGVLTDIDTTVAAAQHDQLMTWLSSQGVDVPPPPPHMEGDTVRMMKHVLVIEMEDSIGGGEFMRVPMPPPAPGEPLPPPPPGAVMMRVPAPPPGHEGEMMIVICDSTMKGKTECRKIIVNEKAPGAVKVRSGAPGSAKRTAAPKNEMKANELVIYPNPSKGQFTLEINIPGKEKAELIISDINGKIVHSEQIMESNEKLTKEIDLSKYGKGMYSIRLNKGGKVIIENVVVE
jgi:hypothetical protein